MIRKIYSRPEAVVRPIVGNRLICQSSYVAPDVIFGDEGGAGMIISDGDINYGGSF